MQKRGQVTVYIILGIIILVAFGFLIFIQFDLLKSEFEKELELNVVPLQLMPVKSYIDSCISDIITDSVFTLSSRGGYLNLPEDILPRSINNPFSNSLELYPGSEVAYWFYESANGLQKEQIPSIESMESEIEDYISREFNSCYPELSFYENEGFEIGLPSYIYSDINIESNYIEVVIDAPTTIRLNEVSKELQKYVLKIDIPLGKFYDKSKEIFFEESENNFLEEITIDILAVYEEIPYNGVELYCGRKTWNKNEVEGKLKEYLFNNIGALRLKGIDYPKSKDPYDYFSVNINTPDGVTSNFLYSSNWPFAMEVTPSQGNFLLSDSLTQSNPDLSRMMNLFLCINYYNFVYDVKYPVLISLMDESGYVFQFATMSILDNNQAKRSEYEFLDFSESIEMKENICNYPSAELSVEAYDYERMEPLANADISYQCSVVTCYLGKTNNQGRFEGIAPTCLNGNVISQKEGYHPGEIMISTNEENLAKENLAITMLYPYTELEVEIKILDLKTGEVKDLEEDQHVSFQFIDEDEDYTVIASDKTETIHLIPGHYQITSYVYGSPNFDIKSEGGMHTECIEIPKEGILGFFLNEEKCFDVELEDIEIESIIIGGAEFEWSVSSLIDYDKIILYAVINEIPRDLSEIISLFSSIEFNHLSNKFRGPELT